MDFCIGAAHGQGLHHGETRGAAPVPSSDYSYKSQLCWAGDSSAQDMQLSSVPPRYKIAWPGHH